MAARLKALERENRKLREAKNILRKASAKGSAGASFLRHDGASWTTDKDSIILGLLAAEITASTGSDPGERYLVLTKELGEPRYARIDAAASPAQKAVLKTLSRREITTAELAGQPITAILGDALPQIAVALLVNPAMVLAAAGLLLRREPAPGRQVTAGFEGCRISHRRDQGAGQQRPDAWDAHQPAADLGGPCAGPDPSIGLQDLYVHQMQLGDQNSS